MRPARAVESVGVLLVIATLAACGPTSARPAAGTPTPAAANTSGGAVAASATLDPCQIVTQQEASALTGVSYGPGKELHGALSASCLYGAGGKNVFRVDVIRGTVAQVHQYRDQVTAEIEAGDADGGRFSKTAVSGLGDEAMAYTLTGSVLNVNSLFIVKATIGLYLLNEVSGTATPTAVLTNQARTALGRMS